MFIIPEKCDTTALQFQYIIGINTILNGLVLAALKGLCAYLSSDKRKNKLKDRLYYKYKDIKHI